MAEIGSITTRAGLFNETVASISTDESIGGILFDISGFEQPFAGYAQLNENFGSQQVHLINNLDDAENLGLKDDGFLSGLAYYHLSMFYDYIGNDRQLYVAFADCSSDWDFIITMQRATNGKMFQLGVWTSQPLFETSQSTLQLSFTRIITDIENVAEELTGKVGQPSGSPIPLNIILSANTHTGFYKFTLRNLPNGTVYNAPKLSVLLCQNGTDEVHEMQSVMPGKTPVGSLGVAMAVLSLAGAEANIGCVQDFNLNRNDHFQYPEIAVNDTYYPLGGINKIVQGILVSNGYIIPTTYPAKEGECYFGGDPTFSSGDYGIISNNRIIHKCRRVVFSVLLPYLHSNQPYSSAAKRLDNIALSMFEEAISSALTGKLVNNSGKYQINGYQIVEFDTKNILSDDAVHIKYAVSPVNYNGTLTETVFAM